MLFSDILRREGNDIVNHTGVGAFYKKVQTSKTQADNRISMVFFGNRNNTDIVHDCVF